MASRAMLSLVEDGVQRRRADRVRLMLSARLVTTTDDFPVMLRDISLTGAMVEGSRLPVTGLDLLLQRGSLEIFSHLVWVNGNRAGLEFETPLDVQDFFAQFPRTTWAPKAAPVAMRRSTLDPEPMTPADWDAIEEWAKPTGRQAYRD